MSISSSDRTVMPENVDSAQLAELVESAVTEAPAGATAPTAEKSVADFVADKQSAEKQATASPTAEQADDASAEQYRRRAGR